MAHLWLLNFDAEEELAKPSAPRTIPALDEKRAALALAVADLLAPGDVYFGDTLPAGNRHIGMAWMMTDRARTLLRSHGVLPVDAPRMEVLKHANSRQFSFGLGLGLPGASYVRHMGELETAIENPSIGSGWLCKRPFGFAGRGRQRLDMGSLKNAARSWCESALRDGPGLEVVPYVHVLAEFGLHGYLAADGTLTRGEPTALESDRKGQWVSSRLATLDELSHNERTALIAAFDVVAPALTRTGYFGPFGIDAFRYKDVAGVEGFCALSEVNARYTMGWAKGMQERRPDLDAVPLSV